MLALLLALTILSCSALPSFADHEAQDDQGQEKHKTITTREGIDASYKFKFSGYFKADYAYDTGKVSTGNYATRVLQAAENDQTSITAREMRIGFDFMWKQNRYRTDAKLEFDFYGLGAEPSSINAMENRATSMLRHAYLKLSKSNWYLLAGQTSDVISPLVPATVNYTVCWGIGNIGYRRPMFRFAAWSDLREGSKLLIDLAAARSLGLDLDGDGLDDGVESPYPTFQGRLAFDVKLSDDGLFALGVSGHYGVEKYGIDDSLETISRSINTDLKIVFNQYVALLGEFFVGQSLGTYLGGVFQSVGPLGNEIGAQGGWSMLQISPTPKWTINGGYSFDDPDKSDFILPPEETGSFVDMNSVIFGNVMYHVTKNVSAMLELSYLETEYFNKSTVGGEVHTESKTYDAFRVQFAMKAAIK
jgi:hypothetical protein